MQKNNFEQKYYDLVYENKKIKQENEHYLKLIEILEKEGVFDVKD